MKIIFCQINVRLGDFIYNLDKITAEYKKAANHGVDLIVFPELALTGYPLYDQVSNPDFLNNLSKCIDLIVKETINNNSAILFGAPLLLNGKIYNAAILAENGEIKGTTLKRHLPNYGIFNESRNFTSSTNQQVIDFRGEKLGVLICEDMWFDDVVQDYIEQGMGIVIVINASPYDVQKHNDRKIKAVNIVKKCNLPLIYVNLIGGQDDMVFDGGSFILDSSGEYILEPQCWSELAISCDTKSYKLEQINKFSYTQTEHIYQALMLALRDYVQKNGFKACLVGLSGGIDSALVATIIADSLGAENLRCIMIPTEFTLDDSIEDAKLLAANIDCKFSIIDITQTYKSFLRLLDPVFENKLPDVTEENLQARIRGVVLMSVSNKMKELLIATSNKSESMMGYATLYGDMCGGFSLIKDLYKTSIYELVHWRNNHIPHNSKLKLKDIIPTQIVTKEPSAELKHNQKDSDILPPYSLLDQILYGLVEQDLSQEMVAKQLGIDISQVKEIKIKIMQNEFKRSQSPIGPKISTKSFNSERKYPITSSL